ncbi:MAG: hypothetical protein LUQ32_03285 [Methanomicrobiales archaeon]|nr:hypothetical protein [Methanomicrobiales archaeon]
MAGLLIRDGSPPTTRQDHEEEDELREGHAKQNSPASFSTAGAEEQWWKC